MLVEFTEEAIKQYLDNCIIKWRKAYAESLNDDQRHTTACYMNAFQIVKIDIFGVAFTFEGW